MSILLKQMKSRNKNKLIILFLLFLFLSVNGFARDYSFPSLDITVQVEEDGSLLVQEKRTVIFDGRFSGLFQWINKQPGEEIVDIRVTEGDVPYEFNPSGDIGPAGTYFINDEPSSTYIDWSFNAINESRTFIITYRIKNAVKLHDDIGEVYYIFNGDEWEKSVGILRAEMILPGDAEGNIRAWGHGPLNGNVEITGKDKVVWEINNVPSRTLVAGRITFPLELIPQGTNFIGSPGLENILASEQSLADQANQERTMSRISLFGGVLAILGGIFLSIFNWFRYGKEPKGDFDGDYYRELPSKRPPVEAGYLYRFKRIDAVDITATILDLGRRGFLEIEEYEPEKRGFFKIGKKTDYRLKKKESGEESEISNHEKLLWKFLFKDVGNGSEVSFEEIEKYGKDNKIDFKEFWDNWKEMIEEKIEAENLFEKTSGKEMFRRSIPGLLSFVIPFFFLLIFKEKALLLFIGFFIAGFIYLLSLASHQRRTEKGASENNRWKAFRKFIKDFSNIDKEEIPSLVIWEHFLVYAISLGVAKEVIKALELAYPDLTQGDYRFGQGWLIYHSGIYSAGSLNKSLESMTTNLNTSLSTAIQTATGQYSSGSGGGGGFSGGGGMGGSGGGGGGAR